MQFRVWFALISIIASVFSVSLVFRVGSWHTPCSSDDELYEEFGPRPSQLLVEIYFDYAAEVAAFMNQEVDIMDWALEPLDYQWFETYDPTHETYSTAFYAEFGSFQWDINNQVLPTSITSVRQAFAHMIDKDYFIATYLGGMAHRADSALAHLPDWYNPACTDLYNFQPRTTMAPYPDDLADWEQAIDLLIADLGPPVEAPERPGYFTWFWWELPPALPGHLLVYAVSDNEARTQQGLHFCDLCLYFLPAAAEALGKQRIFLYVDLVVAPEATCKEQVMGLYNYHLYTGHWVFRREPDTLLYYTTAFITKPIPYGKNYVMYSDLLFDDEVDLMITSDSPGSETNPCDGVYHAWVAQEIMEGREPVIWGWNTAGYKAYLSNWEGMVNERGKGINSWWTFMNAHKIGSESCDTIRYGWAGDLESLNIISASAYRDYEVLGKIYDTLIKFNPYDLEEDCPWIACDWEIGTWLNGMEFCTRITFHIRQDVWWQDLPAGDRSAITWNRGPQLDGSIVDQQLTPRDVVFSFIYQAYNRDASNGWRAAHVHHCGLNVYECYPELLEWTTCGPTGPHWWDPVECGPFPNDYARHADIDACDIDVYFDVYAPWLALHWVGELPLIPYHIWSEIRISESDDVDTWGSDVCYGTGPYILFSTTLGVSMTMIPFRTGQTYRGITLTHSYYALPTRPTETDPYSIEVVQYGNATQQDIVSGIIFRANFHGYDRIRAHDIEYYFTYGLRWAGGSCNDTSPTFTSPPIPFCTTWTAEWLLRWRDVAPSIPVGAVVMVHVDLHWHIASCWEYNPITQEYDIPNFDCNFLNLRGHLEEGLPTCPNWYTFTVNRGILRCVYSFPADINGDGIVDIGDGSQVGLYWQVVY